MQNTVRKLLHLKHASFQPAGAALFQPTETEKVLGASEAREIRARAETAKPAELASMI